MPTEPRLTWKSARHDRGGPAVPLLTCEDCGWSAVCLPEEIAREVQAHKGGHAIEAARRDG